MAGIGLFATLFWDTGILKPLKLLLVLIHEMWHGLAAMVSGAVLDKIILHAGESGETMVSHLNSKTGFLFTVSAGYIGSAITGALLLNRGLQASFERLTLLTFAGLLLYMSFLFTDVGKLAFYTGVGWSIVLMPFAFSRRLARFALILMGTIFVWYCFYDMFDFTRDVRTTDAGILATYLSKQGILKSSPDSTIVAYTISVIWCIAVVACIALFLRPVFMRRPSPPPPPEAEPASDIPEEFPGELTPQVQEWFLNRGLGPDGQPLPEELLALRAELGEGGGAPGAPGASTGAPMNGPGTPPPGQSPLLTPKLDTGP